MATQRLPLKLKQLSAGFSESLSRFWNWWSGELLSLLPESWRDRFQTQSRLLLIELEEARCSVKFGPNGRFNPVTSFQFGPDTVLPGVVAQQLLETSKRADDIVLVAPSRAVLKKQISLPGATESSLASVLQFEMDRHTPFSADQVYFGYRVTARNKAAGRITVELIVVTRAVLDPLLARFAQLNIKPTVVTIPSSSAGQVQLELNLLPASERENVRQRDRRWRRWRLLLGVAILAAAAVLPVYQRELRIEQLQAALVEPRAIAGEARAVEDELKQLIESRQFLARRKADAPSELVLLHELTTLLPDNTWLLRFEHHDGVAKLQGESADASVLIGILEQSELLTNVRFSSPVTTNPRTQKERFSIEAVTSREEGP